MQIPQAGKILIIRLDRIGDVVLSTPFVKALRDAYPKAHLAMMVRPLCKDVVEGNPHLNEVILYDKGGVVATLGVAARLRQRRFDAAIILHATTRSHLVAALAGIPVRIGYPRKSSWLLTHRLSDRKHEGTRHESEYVLDVARELGLTPSGPPSPVVPIQPAARDRVASWLAEQGVRDGEPLVAIHPGSSAISKRWLPERFAQVADRLIDERHVRIVIVGGPDDAQWSGMMRRAMRRPALDASGQLSVAELIALLSRAALFIANDSGPVHLAAAVGTPVVAIFGRNQPGLSSPRWRPLGTQHVVLQKDVGCPTCPADACTIAFKCLTELTVDEVYAAVCEIVDRRK